MLHSGKDREISRFFGPTSAGTILQRKLLINKWSGAGGGWFYRPVILNDNLSRAKIPAIVYGALNEANVHVAKVPEPKPLEHVYRVNIFRVAVWKSYSVKIKA
jgi:hypothetical protein